MSSQYDVFLSHATPDKPAVESIARRLHERGIRCFLDSWNLIPGQPITENLEKALRASGSCAVFLGPAQPGPWHREELYAALENQVRKGEFPVIPVLLPGTTQPSGDDMPWFLSRRLWVDFRASMEDEDALHRLICGIRGQAPGPGVAPEPSTIPPATSTAKPGLVRFSGRQKLAVCDRLSADWSRLATLLDIPPHDQSRFSQGDEGRRIWEWLEIRGRLGELPGALSDIDRQDLADILNA